MPRGFWLGKEERGFKYFYHKITYLLTITGGEQGRMLLVRLAGFKQISRVKQYSLSQDVQLFCTSMVLLRVFMIDDERTERDRLMLDEHGCHLCHLVCCTCYNGKMQGERKKESRFTE